MRSPRWGVPDEEPQMSSPRRRVPDDESQTRDPPRPFVFSSEFVLVSVLVQVQVLVLVPVLLLAQVLLLMPVSVQVAINLVVLVREQAQILIVVLVSVLEVVLGIRVGAPGLGVARPYDFRRCLGRVYQGGAKTTGSKPNTFCFFHCILLRASPG